MRGTQNQINWRSPRVPFVVWSSLEVFASWDSKMVTMWCSMLFEPERLLQKTQVWASRKTKLSSALQWQTCGFCFPWQLPASRKKQPSTVVGPPVWGHWEGISDLRSLFLGTPPFVPICSYFCQFVPICFHNKSEEIRDFFFADPFASPRIRGQSNKSLRFVTNSSANCNKPPLLANFRLPNACSHKAISKETFAKHLNFGNGGQVASCLNEQNAVRKILLFYWCDCSNKAVYLKKAKKRKKQFNNCQLAIHEITCGKIICFGQTLAGSGLFGRFCVGRGRS